jgi:hypothetical protein
VGSPLNIPEFFNDGTYFKFVTDTLEGELVARSQYPDIVVNDPKSFVGSFEGDSCARCLDSAGVPTISVGINIRAQIGET